MTKKPKQQGTLFAPANEPKESETEKVDEAELDEEIVETEEEAAELEEFRQEIAELKQELDALKADGEKDAKGRKSTADARKEGGKTGRQQKKIYARWKEVALEHEPTNYSKLYIVHENQNWWKLFGHSAVMLY